MRNRHRALWHQIEAIFRELLRQQNHPFDHRKPGPGVNTRHRQKQHISGALAGLAVLGLPASGVKFIRIFLNPFKPVQVPLRQHDLHAGFDVALSKNLCPRGFAHHHRHRLIHPQAFAEHVVRGFKRG